ncbi:unnamed protein product, partial [Darwinula stevensoni]
VRIKEIYSGRMTQFKKGNLHLLSEKEDSRGRAKMKDLVRNILRGIIVFVSTAIAFNQVIALIEEFRSVPISTLQVKKRMDRVRAPAFTFCPWPSVNATSWAKWKPGDDYSSGNSTFAELFEITSVAWNDMILKISRDSSDNQTNWTFVKRANGENIWEDSQGSQLIERTVFSYEDKDDILFAYYKCFTLLLNESIKTGANTSRYSYFQFDLSELEPCSYCYEKKYMEVYIHDQREPFSSFLGAFAAEKITLYPDLAAYVQIRPEFWEQLHRESDPCQKEENYSHMRISAKQCIENCFWEKVQSLKELPCLNPRLLPKEARVNISECTTVVDEKKQFSILDQYLAETDDLNCNCPVRCKYVDYHVSATTFNANWTGMYFSIPSMRVLHLKDTVKMNTLDLLSSLGGIVGICLGISIVSVLDIVLEAFFFLWAAFKGKLGNSGVVGRVHEYSSSPALKSTKVTYCFLLPYRNLGRRSRCSKELSSFQDSEDVEKMDRNLSVMQQVPPMRDTKYNVQKTTLKFSYGTVP